MNNKPVSIRNQATNNCESIIEEEAQVTKEVMFEVAEEPRSSQRKTFQNEDTSLKCLLYSSKYKTNNMFQKHINKKHTNDKNFDICKEN